MVIAVLSLSSLCLPSVLSLSLCCPLTFYLCPLTFLSVLLLSSHCPVLSLSLSMPFHFHLSVLSQSSHFHLYPLTLLFLPSLLPLIVLLLSSFCPLSYLSLSSFHPLTALSLSSHCPVSVLLLSSLRTRRWSHSGVSFQPYFVSNWPQIEFKLITCNQNDLTRLCKKQWLLISSWLPTWNPS